jgi:hypothetical protein
MPQRDQDNQMPWEASPMRHLRPFSALLAIAAITVACSSAPGGSSGAQNSQGAEASQGVEASQPSESTGGGDGGGGGGGGGGSGANGSATYEITGDYSASGELPFIPLGLSQFVDGGWFAYFGETGGDTILQISTNPEGLIANFGSPQASVPGTEDNGCDFNITKNDSSGLTGSFECHDVLAFTQGTVTQIRVDFRGEFDAHP